MNSPSDANAANRQELPPLLSTYRQRAHELRWWRRWFVIFEPRDLWIGIFVSPEKYDEVSGDFVQRTYFALIPTIVLVHQRWKPGFQIGAEDRGSYADV